MIRVRIKIPENIAYSPKSLAASPMIPATLLPRPVAAK